MSSLFIIFVRLQFVLKSPITLLQAHSVRLAIFLLFQADFFHNHSGFIVVDSDHLCAGVRSGSSSHQIASQIFWSVSALSCFPGHHTSFK